MAGAPPKILVDALVKSMDEQPSEWRFDADYAEHKRSRTFVWVSSSPTYVGISRSLDDATSPVYGGVTFPSVLFGGWLIPWRRKLWRAVKRGHSRVDGGLLKQWGLSQ